MLLNYTGKVNYSDGLSIKNGVVRYTEWEAIRNMIRIANKADLADIVAIYNESIPGRLATADTHEIPVESRFAWFAEHQGQRPLWVHEKESEIAGWLSLQNFYNRPAYQATVEISIYVKNTFKQQGIAKNLMAHALDSCPTLNITTVLGYIFGHNVPSINLFSRFGFKKWGHLPEVAQLDGLQKDVVIYGLKIS